MIAPKLPLVALGDGLLAFGLVCFFAASVCLGQNNRRPAPTHRNVSYGPHERNVLDTWLAGSDAPTPLVVYIHGGGFRGGRKESINANTLEALLDAGVSVAALHYRFVQQKRLPAAHDDCRRALQFLRSKAHHVMFGVKLKEKMDALGIEADLKYPGASPKYASMADFFKAKLCAK